jgi:beta-phosphoglucomutase-like phosphatase (HAD superfamily)
MMENPATQPITLPTWLLIVVITGGATGLGGGLSGLLGGGGDDALRAEDEVRIAILEDGVKATDEAIDGVQKDLRTLRDNQIAICTATNASCR